MFTSAEQQSGLEQLQHNRLNLESVYNKSYISTRTEELLGPLLELLLDENPLRWLIKSSHSWGSKKLQDYKTFIRSQL